MTKKYTILTIMAVIVCAAFAVVLLATSSNASEKTDEYKIINMFDENTGWAVTNDNELVRTEGGADSFEVIRQVPESWNVSFPDGQSVYLSGFSEDGAYIIVEYTTDAGGSWYNTKIDYKGYLENGGDAGEVFIDFLDQANGYILYCSTPALGQMLKLLFRSIDGGKSFELVSDLSGTILGYPTGIGFQDNDHGYIAFTYHGADYFLFETNDGAKTWESVEPFFDESYSYIDSYPPYFYGEGRQNGKLLLKFVDNDNDSKIQYKLFSTNDAGQSWVEEKQ